MFVFGYWSMGNRQIFFNHVGERRSISENINPDHKIFDYSLGINHTLMVLVALVAIVGGQVMYNLIRACLLKCGAYIAVSKFDQDIDVDENLAPYWNSLPSSQQKVWYANEVYLRNSLGLKTIDDTNLELLRVSS